MVNLKMFLSKTDLMNEHYFFFSSFLKLVQLVCLLLFVVTALQAGAQAQQLEEEMYEFKYQRPKITAKGHVYCDQCGEGLWGRMTVPLEEVEVNIKCKDLFGFVTFSGVGYTNEHGAYKIPMDEIPSVFGVEGCKARIVKSTNPYCEVPTSLGNGDSGATLELKSKTLKEIVFTSGPFACKPSHRPSKCKKTHHHKGEAPPSLGFFYFSPPPPSPSPYFYKSPPPPPYYNKPPPTYMPPSPYYYKSPPPLPPSPPPPYLYKSPPPPPPYLYISPPPPSPPPPPYSYKSPPPPSPLLPPPPYYYESPPPPSSPPPYLYKSPPPPPPNWYISPPPPPSPP
eukprot:c6282_g1_i1 orf=2-1012(-)